MSRPLFNRTLDLEYFSGSQACIYIGDVWVDEITYFEYTTRQTKQPIYGYASQLFDACAAGHVLATGAFAINYKEAGYLWTVLRRWFGMEMDSISSGSKQDPINSSKKKALFQNKINSAGGVGGAPIVGSNGTKVSRAGIERLMNGQMSQQERYDFYQTLQGFATEENGVDKTFEDVVEIFEDQIWGTQNNDKLIEQLRRTDDNAFDGFDMYATFGNYANLG
jgi:hypothetical protein